MTFILQNEFLTKKNCECLRVWACETCERAVFKTKQSCKCIEEKHSKNVEIYDENWT